MTMKKNWEEKNRTVLNKSDEGIKCQDILIQILIGKFFFFLTF